MNQTVVFLPMLLVLGAFMFFASRRQKRAMQATIDLHESLRIGDQVQTTSGLHGTIKRITDDIVDLEIAPGVVTTWAKLAVGIASSRRSWTLTPTSSAIWPTSRATCPPTEVAVPPRTLFGAVEPSGAREANGGVTTCTKAHRA